jgi:hypothetical protein
VTPNRHPDPPPWPIYESVRDEVIELVGGLDDADLERPVPLTPAWSTADVVAHLCGLTADVAAGMRTGLGTPERTRHQVGSRAGRTVTEVCVEWRTNAPAMRAAMEDDPFFGHRLTADLAVHRHDLQHAHGVPSRRDDLATRCGAHNYARVVTGLLLERSGVALRVELDDGSGFAPAGAVDPDLTLRTTAFDWLRTATGRRSRQEALALDWSHDPTELLDHLCPYGPLRTSDSDF